MADEGLTQKSVRELAAMIRSRAVSPLEVLDAHLAVIARVNSKLNAIVTLAEETARIDAKAVEAATMRGESVGPLAGLPIAIKDLTHTAGIRTTFGSPLYKNYVPEQDAEIVRRLKAAGAIVLGKSNTPEFGAGANTLNAVFGATRNPWNPDFSPGGGGGGGGGEVEG
jgi:amidase